MFKASNSLSKVMQLVEIITKKTVNKSSLYTIANTTRKNHIIITFVISQNRE